MKTVSENNIEHLTFDDINRIISQVIASYDDDNIRIINISDEDGAIHIKETKYE